jgi:hypothetical protein
MKVAEALRTMTAGPYVTDLLLDHNCIAMRAPQPWLTRLLGTRR